jgi:hypothetical protein
VPRGDKLVKMDLAKLSLKFSVVYLIEGEIFPITLLRLFGEDNAK